MATANNKTNTDSEKKQTTTTARAKRTTTKPKSVASTNKRTAKPKTPNELLSGVIDEVCKDENKTELNDGKLYSTVKTRLFHFRKTFGFDVKIITILKNLNEGIGNVLFEAQIYFKNNDQWDLVANGHAFETKSSSDTNLLNFLENAETSAIGRALSCLGIDGGSISEAELIKQIRGADSKSTVNRVGKQTKKVEESASEEQIKKISEILKVNKNTTLESILKQHKVSKIQDLTKKDADEVINIIDIDEPL